MDNQQAKLEAARASARAGALAEAAALIAAARGLQAIAVDHDERSCAIIHDRLGLLEPDPSEPLLVAVSPTGQPHWPSLGRLQPQDELQHDLSPRAARATRMAEAVE